MDEEDIARAKVEAAVNAMREMLDAASEAAHELKEHEWHSNDKDYPDFDRVVTLGHVVDAKTSGPLRRARMSAAISSKTPARPLAASTFLAATATSPLASSGMGRMH
jgi:hypothetical protein